MKGLIYLGIGIGGTVGGWLGALATHGNLLSGLSILGTMLGSFVGLWAGYKVGSNL
jgi:hypothetical protein